MRNPADGVAISARWLRLAPVMVAVVVVLIGVAVQLARPSSTGAGAPHGGDPRQAAAQAAAEDEARRLLGLVTTPPGAREVAAAPVAGLGGPMGTPASDSLITATGFWTVPMPAADALAWFAAHPPSGLVAAGQSRGGGSGSEYIGLAYSAPDSDAWTGAQLQIAIASTGGAASAVRVDGMALWLDPIPDVDSADGPRLQVSAASGCPASDEGIVGVSNPLLGLTDALLPPGPPVGGLRCDYLGDCRGLCEGMPFQLESSTTLDTAAAVRLAAKASALPLSHTNGDRTGCLAVDGSASVLVLSYPSGQDVALWISEPCAGFIVANGFIVVTGTPFADE